MKAKTVKKKQIVPTTDEYAGNWDLECAGCYARADIDKPNKKEALEAGIEMGWQELTMRNEMKMHLCPECVTRVLDWADVYRMSRP